MNAALSTSRLDSLYSGFLSRPHQLFIDGKWTPAQSGETFAVLDPSTGREIAQVAAGNAADVDLAVKAARRAFPGRHHHHQRRWT
jgi:phenylacetaldehyde dehydrogenase